MKHTYKSKQIDEENRLLAEVMDPEYQEHMRMLQDSHSGDWIEERMES